MSRPQIHPKAFLAKKRNVKAGLLSRTKIIRSLESGGKSVREICDASKLTYSCVTYHLRSLSRERLVSRSKSNSRNWALTAYGQQALA